MVPCLFVWYKCEALKLVHELKLQGLSNLQSRFLLNNAIVKIKEHLSVWFYSFLPPSDRDERQVWGVKGKKPT